MQILQNKYQKINFTLIFISSYPNLNNFKKQKNQKQIFYKNYLYFYLIIKSLFLLNNTIKLNSITSIFSKKKNDFKTYLNAPNRHKISLTKLQFKFFSFQIISNFSIFFSILSILFYLKFFFSLFKKLFLFFESYILTLKKKQIKFSFFLNYNVLLKINFLFSLNKFKFLNKFNKFLNKSNKSNKHNNIIFKNLYYFFSIFFFFSFSNFFFFFFNIFFVSILFYYYIAIYIF